MLMCCQINHFLIMTILVKSWTKDHLDKASAKAHHIVLVINKINSADLWGTNDKWVTLFIIPGFFSTKGIEVDVDVRHSHGSWCCLLSWTKYSQKSKVCLPNHIALLKLITQWWPDMEFFLWRECSHKWLLCYSLQLCWSQTSHRWADLRLRYKKKRKKAAKKIKLLVNGPMTACSDIPYQAPLPTLFSAAHITHQSLVFKYAHNLL